MLYFPYQVPGNFAGIVVSTGKCCKCLVYWPHVKIAGRRFVLVHMRSKTKTTNDEIMSQTAALSQMEETSYDFGLNCENYSM